ncbi:MAG: hypothetical protein QMD50_01095 [Patescibacteria group bacterium]|nr:hypothetical protein [Patescibacteria group bacterium]
MDPRLIHHTGQVYYIAQNRGVFAIADQNTYKQLETLRQSKESVEKFLNSAIAKEKRSLTVFVFAGDQY